jgi:hypothetical protein
MKYLFVLLALFFTASADAQQQTKGKTKKHHMESLQQLLEDKNVNGSIIEIDNFIGNVCDYGESMEVLSIPQRKFYINQNLEREVNNGGFHQYFWNSAGEHAEETVLSLKEIGAVKTAEILQKAIDMFPKSKVPKNRAERQKLVEKIDPETEVWEKLDKKFMDYEEDLNALNIQFVAKHKASF